MEIGSSTWNHLSLCIVVCVMLINILTQVTAGFICPQQYRRSDGTCCQSVICQKDEDYRYCSNTTSIGRDRCFKCGNNKGNPVAVNTSIAFEAFEGSYMKRCFSLICQCPPEADCLEHAFDIMDVKCQCKRPLYYGRDPNVCQPTPKLLLQKQHKAGCELTLDGTVEMCKKGTFKAENSDALCIPHSQCKNGEVKLKDGTHTKDVVCGLSGDKQTPPVDRENSETNNGTESGGPTFQSTGTNQTDMYILIGVGLVVVVALAVGVYVCVKRCCARSSERQQSELRLLESAVPRSGVELSVPKDSGLSLNEASVTSSTGKDSERHSLGNRSGHSYSSGRGSDTPERQSIGNTSEESGPSGGRGARYDNGEAPPSANVDTVSETSEDSTTYPKSSTESARESSTDVPFAIDCTEPSTEEIKISFEGKPVGRVPPTPRDERNHETTGQLVVQPTDQEQYAPRYVSARFLSFLPHRQLTAQNEDQQQHVICEAEEEVPGPASSLLDGLLRDDPDLEIPSHIMQEDTEDGSDETLLKGTSE